MWAVLEPTHRVKARKRHTCDWCGKLIEVGEEHGASAMARDGIAYTWRECDRCAPYVGPMMDYWDRTGDEGYGREDMSYYMAEEHPGVWAEWQEADGR